MSHSSIFSFETLRGVRPGRFAGAIAAAAALLGCEASLRLFQARLPQPRLWGEGESSTKVAQFERFAPRPGGRIDGLILGPSHASMCISPAAMRGEWGTNTVVYNAGINGRDYPVVEFLFRHAFLKRARPSFVVITISPICFNRNYSPIAGNTAEFFASPAPGGIEGTGVVGLIERWMVSNVHLYRYRWRGPRLSDGFVGGKPVLDEFGFHGAAGAYSDAVRMALLDSDHPYYPVWQNYEFGGAAVEALRLLIREAQAAGARVVLVDTPFLPPLLELPGEPRAAIAQYDAEISRIAEANGVVRLNYRESSVYEMTDFRDTDHLNKRGAAKLSRILAADLARLGVLPVN